MRLEAGGDEGQGNDEDIVTEMDEEQKFIVV